MGDCGGCWEITGAADKCVSLVRGAVVQVAHALTSPYTTACCIGVSLQSLSLPSVCSKTQITATLSEVRFKNQKKKIKSYSYFFFNTSLMNISLFNLRLKDPCKTNACYLLFNKS